MHSSWWWQTIGLFFDAARVREANEMADRLGRAGLAVGMPRKSPKSSVGNTAYRVSASAQATFGIADGITDGTSIARVWACRYSK